MQLIQPGPSFGWGGHILSLRGEPVGRNSTWKRESSKVTS